MSQTSRYIVRINFWFEHMAVLLLKIRRLIFISGAVILLLLGSGLYRFKTKVTIDSFFLKSDPIMLSKARFMDMFGNNDFIGILVESDDVFSFETLSRIRSLGNELKKKVPFADELISLADFSYFFPGMLSVNKIGSVPIPEDSNERENWRKMFDKRKSIAGRLYSTDYTQAWIILRLKEYPKLSEWKEKEEPAIYAGRRAMQVVEKYRAEGMKLTPTGIPVLAYRKNFEMFRETSRVLAVAAIIGLISIFLMFYTIQGIVGTILIIINSIIIVFGTLGWLQIPADISFLLVPVLLGIAVAISYTIHLASTFNRHLMRTGKKKESVIYALKESAWPVLFSAATTIAAMFSFWLVPIQPIRWVGTVSAFMIFIILINVLFLFPAILSLGGDFNLNREYYQKRSSRIDEFFAAMGEWGLKHGTIILTIFFLILGIMLFGMTKLKVDLNTRKMLGTRLPHVYDQVYAGESKIGSMYSYDIMLTFPEENKIADPEVLKKFDKFATIINNAPLIKKTRSACDLLKEINQVVHNDDSNHFVIPEDGNIIASWISAFERQAPDEARAWYNKKHTTLRLFVEVSDFSAVEFQKQIKYIKSMLDEIYPPAEYPGLRHDVVGNLLQISTMNQYVTEGQIKSLSFSLLTIMIMMMIVFGSVKLGLIGMIPNIAPVIAAGGIMGYMGVPLEFVTITIAPMVLGLAVDNTIHIINNAKLEFYHNEDYHEAILLTFTSIGKPASKAAFILCSTFIAFLFSKVNNLINMGIYMVIAMAFALASDLYITPLLIKIFKPFGNQPQK